MIATGFSSWVTESHVDSLFNSSSELLSNVVSEPKDTLGSFVMFVEVGSIVPIAAVEFVSMLT